MQQKVSNIRNEFEGEIHQAENSKSIDALKVKYLGKKGLLSGLMQELKNCSGEERPLFGKIINELKTEISQSLDSRAELLLSQETQKQLSEEHIDVTLPGRRNHMGRIHPISKTLDEVVNVLTEMGFSAITGPEIESEYYNYTGLNFPLDHPARDMQDTYYITPEKLLRTHNTCLQQRLMEVMKPPIRAIFPGKCYRNETITARSHVLFHQVDGLYIDKDVTFADLLATLKLLYTKVFGKEVEMRVRPSYFPFVEPGMEVDIRCTKCEGSGCKLCKNTGWLEVCGAGMVHPEVLSFGGIDPEEYSGFAWGGGIERLFMLKHGVSDIRLFTENDMRFLGQFNYA